MLPTRWWRRQERWYSHLHKRDVPCFPAGSFDDIDQIVDEVLADIDTKVIARFLGAE